MDSRLDYSCTVPQSSPAQHRREVLESETHSGCQCDANLNNIKVAQIQCVKSILSIYAFLGKALLTSQTTTTHEKSRRTMPNVII